MSATEWIAIVGLVLLPLGATVKYVIAKLEHEIENLKSYSAAVYAKATDTAGIEARLESLEEAIREVKQITVQVLREVKR